MFWRVHLAHTGRRGIGLLQGLEDRIRRNVRLLAVVCFILSVLDRFSPPWLIFVIWVIFFVLHPQALCLLYKRTLLNLVEQSRMKY